MFGRMLPSSGQYVEQQGTGGYVFKPRGMKLIIYLKAQCYFFPSSVCLRRFTHFFSSTSKGHDGFIYTHPTSSRPKLRETLYN